MNEKDLQLVHTVSSAFDADGSPSTYLLHAKYTNLVRVNLVLLKALLEDKKRKGMMVTIDRPHQYVSHLLQLHGVDQTNLVFIDTISGHASDTKGGALALQFHSGPFQIETLPDFLYGSNGGTDALVNMKDIEFVIIDNVSTLLTYNTMDSVRKFFQKYVESVQKHGPKGMQTVLVMDRDLHPDLFKFLEAMAKKSIELGPDMVIKSISAHGAPGLGAVAPASKEVS